MMDKYELKKLIEKTTEERLCEIVIDWIDNNENFRSFPEHELNPPADGMDEELKELVTYFKDEYKTRPSLMTELRKIKTK